MPKNSSAIFPSPIGNLSIQTQQNKLAAINFSSDRAAKNFQDNLSRTIHQELQSYFQNPQYNFQLELHLEGTDFQKKVWNALRKIPSGTTVSYGTLAKQLKSSPRAIGNACRANPIAIVIPCHRVVAQNHIGGYSGETQGSKLDIKKWLLRHEGHDDKRNNNRT